MTKLFGCLTLFFGFASQTSIIGGLPVLTAIAVHQLCLYFASVSFFVFVICGAVTSAAFICDRVFGPLMTDAQLNAQRR